MRVARRQYPGRMALAAWVCVGALLLLNVFSVLHTRTHCHACEHPEEEGRCQLIRALIQPAAAAPQPAVIVRWVLSVGLSAVPAASPALGVLVAAASRGPPFA
ncbi:MAG: hypothetical protein N2111_09515 [Candidatus Sumerlaeaceae bacterium]|nr:hypothetical protein [Candidatus Sumerlaeaceae bacterium]